MIWLEKVIYDVKKVDERWLLPQEMLGKSGLVSCFEWEIIFWEKCFGSKEIKKMLRISRQIKTWLLKLYTEYLHIFNTVLIRLVSWIKITLLLKIQWKQHHILYIKIVYKHNMTPRKFTLKGGGLQGLITECARDRDLYKLISCGKFVNDILFIKHTILLWGITP